MTRPQCAPATCNHLRRLHLRLLGAASLATLLAGCASTPPASPPPSEAQLWRGKIALQVEDPENPQSYSGSFLLKGSLEQGELEVLNPVGNIVAQLHWSEHTATLDNGKEIVHDTSLDTLLGRVFGTPLPTQALFAWLDGKAVQTPGWQVNLSRYARGRIDAERYIPGPTAKLRIVLHKEHSN